MHFFVTGHTGFKGSWLTLLLRHKGHDVSGYSLDPEPHSLFEKANVAQELKWDYRSDIRNRKEFESALKTAAPDILIHMAAQPLVREGYRDPMTTFETNVNGTLNVLQASATCESVKAQVIITTDKVYRNRNQRAGYVENDELGGDDPYSASKAMADILTQSWIKSFPKIPTAIARAGNVIGGGDVSKDRLFPDLISSFAAGKPVILRYPKAVRPWQHVLDCVDGYLALVDYLLEGGTDPLWNFGPRSDEFKEVREVAERVGELWNVNPSWQLDESTQPHEAGLLALDSSKARSTLNWKDKFDFEQSVKTTSHWYRDVLNGTQPKDATIRDIKSYLEQ